MPAAVAGNPRELSRSPSAPRSSTQRIGADVAEAQQSYRRGSALRPGEWNNLEIEVRGQTYAVRLNGFETARFTNSDRKRGLPAKPGGSSGYGGLQSRNSPVEYRAVRISR